MDDEKLKAFLINIDIIVLAKDIVQASNEAMRVAPQIHFDETPSVDSKICYVEERPLCPACKGVNIETNTKKVRGKKHWCVDCHEAWS